MAQPLSDWTFPLCSFFEEIGPFFYVWAGNSLGAGVCAISTVQCHNRNASEGAHGTFAYCCNYFFLCYGGAFNRMQLREVYGIKGNYCTDFALYFFCLGLCAVVQEYREVKFRGRHGQPLASA